MASADAGLDIQMAEREIAWTYSSDGLPAVAAAVHDWWFDIGDAVVDNRGVVTLHLAQSTRALRDGIRPLRVLRIGDVREVNIDDTERVGIYDIEELAFDERASQLLLLGGVPVKVSFAIGELDLSVAEVVT